jgi:DNA-directed RNA polymerase subunit omega
LNKRINLIIIGGVELVIEPPMESLMEKVDSKYSLVVATAKRARQLVNDANKLEKSETNNPVVVAINEINDNKITYIRTKSGIK